MKQALLQLNRITERIAPALFLVVFVFQFGFPHLAVAAPAADTISAPTVFRSAEPTAPIEEVIPPLQVVKTYNVPMTAYNSEPRQTDDTPCITANGFDLCRHNTEDVVAANFLPFNTKIRIPEYFGDRVFTVQDRMNKRYGYRVDIWFKDRQAALNFGIKRNALIEVVE